jgi:hypothetical protein
MVFEGTYGTFCGVTPMDIGWGQLGINVVIGEVLEEGLGGFIVKAVQLWFEASGEE